MNLFANITKDHLLQAINKIDQEGIPPKGNSQYYDVVYEGKKYPPKLIASYAYFLLHEETLDRNRFPGGLGTDCFKLLEKHGFQIVGKNDGMPKIWFVVQGKTFPHPGSQFLWAPQKGKDGRSRFFWENVKKVKKGDIIFHYSKGIQGVSYATSDFYLSKNENEESQWAKEGFKVDVQFFPFEQPISREKIVDLKGLFFKLLIDIPNKPFKKDGGINEGYLYEFSKEAGMLIRKLYGKSLANEMLEKVFYNGEEIEELEESQNLNHKEIIERAYEYIKSCGFRFNPQEISNFYLSLKTKPFVILAGVSGTGKTQLPRKFAEALGMSKEQVIQVPVRPDWTDGSDLLGYTGLDGLFKPKALSEAIKRATKEENRNKPFFFILDEMNLARVEHYFSDFLSIIETRQWKEGKITTDPMIREEILDNATNKLDFTDFIWPENLYLIGTVNMDETTHAFSRKVLDRANSIEMNEIDLNWTSSNDGKMVPSNGITNAFFKSEYLNSLDLSENDRIGFETNMGMLKEINEILKEADLHFAYRVRDEIAFYLTLNKRYGLLDEKEAIDFQLMQKVLPRIHGSSERIQKVLVNLYNYLENDSISHLQLADLKNKADKDLKYKRTSKKIVFMLKRYEDDGFTSFWL